MIATLRVTRTSRTDRACTVVIGGERTEYTMTVGPDRVCGVMVERLQSWPLRVGPIAEHLHELVRAEIQRPGVARYELHVDGGVVTHTAVAVAA